MVTPRCHNGLSCCLLRLYNPPHKKPRHYVHHIVVTRGEQLHLAKAKTCRVQSAMYSVPAHASFAEPRTYIAPQSTSCGVANTAWAVQSARWRPSMAEQKQQYYEAANPPEAQAHARIVGEQPRPQIRRTFLIQPGAACFLAERGTNEA